MEPYITKILILLVLVTSAYYYKNILMTTVFMHRGLTHSAFKPAPWVHSLAVNLLLSEGHRVRRWIGVHRWHHTENDGPEDPHSPRNYLDEPGGGVKFVHAHGLSLYRVAAQNMERIRFHTRNYRETKLEAWIERRNFPNWVMPVMIWIPTLTVLMWLTHFAMATTGFGDSLLEPWLWLSYPLIAGSAVGLGAVLYINTSSAVNSIGHDSETSDPKSQFSSNHPWRALVDGGELWHRNHHTVSWNSRLRPALDFRRRPFWSLAIIPTDTGYIMIKVMEKLRMVSGVRVA